MTARARAVLAIGMLCAAACQQPSVYACTDTSQCRIGRLGGTCEAEGYCSFPDASCASGRRFGELASASLAEQCVPETPDPEGESASSEDDGSTSTTSNATAPVDPSAEASSESTAAVAETSGGPTVDASTSGAEPDGESSSDAEGPGSTGLGDGGCVHTVIDDFGDGVVDPAWDLSVPPYSTVDESAGELVVSVSASAATNAIVARSLAQPMIEGYVRVRLAHIDDPTSEGTGGLVVALPGYEVQIYVGEGCLRAHLVGTGQLGWTDLPADRPLWLQLRRDAEGEMHFEYSADETNWVALASDPAPDFDDAEAEPTFGVFVGAAGLTRRFDEISTCLVP